MASLRGKPTTKQDTNSQEVLKEPPKKAHQSERRKKLLRASTVATPGKTLISIQAGNKRKRHKKHITDNIQGSPNPKDETICHAAYLECRLADIDVVMEGNASNGSLCSKCQKSFHFVCLFRHQEDNYCKDCYKEHVVSQSNAGTLFEELFQSQGTEKAQTGRTYRETDLVKHVDNFLKAAGMPMTTKQYYDWKNREGDQNTRYSASDYRRKTYEKIMDLGKKEWLLSTDGVVKDLRYDKDHKHFVAKVHYEKGSETIQEKIRVSDEWVIDTFGKDVTAKLMDRGEHDNYMLPVNEEGRPIVLQLDQRRIHRVKYFPAKYVHKTNDQGEDATTDEVYASGHWSGMLDDGTVMPVPEELVTAQFGLAFRDECKRLGQRKYVAIPVGSCRSSLMTVFPQLRCEKAPPVKFMQGEMDTCVFSSLASAFFNTTIRDLVRVANILHEQSNRLAGGARCLNKAKTIVSDNVKWLQPQRLPKQFDWDIDMNDYMFVVGVIKDSTNSCQHAVTIFRNWIYDSNEPFALPLTQESLDCCTWDVQDGVIREKSSFVCFIDGWIFKEPEEKRKKVLDMCA